MEVLVNRTAETTKSLGNGMVEFIEHEVDEFDFTGFEVVRQELFSTTTRPAVTLKPGSIVFNVYAIKKLGECTHIQIFAHLEKKLLIVKPCNENGKDAVQWSKEDKNGKLKPKTITNKTIVNQIYQVMNCDLKDTFKMLGRIQKNGNEKMFVFYQ